MRHDQHPGVRVKEELEKRGWNQQDLRYILGCSTKAVNLIINGKQGISPAMSKALGQAFDLSPKLFADLQLSFELSSTTEPDPKVELRARMMKNYPVREMVRRGWLPAKPKDFNQELAAFFEVDSPDRIPAISHAARKTNYQDPEIPPAQLAWIFRVRQVARSISVPKYSAKKLQAALAEMKIYLGDPEEARHVPRLLSDCGVRFVIVQALPKSGIDGVCLWLSKAEPVIGMSMQHDRIDKFWFVLRHEIEHVLNKDGQDAEFGMVDIALEGDCARESDSLPDAEIAANAAAADFCVPSEKMQSFLIRKNPFFYEKDVVAFSKLQKVHPGLTVGQIQNATKRYDYLTKYQTKIRQFVLPNAIVDGFKQSAMVT